MYEDGRLFCVCVSGLYLGLVVICSLNILCFFLKVFYVFFRFERIGFGW